MYQKVDYPERKCAFCGAAFKPKTKSTRFCSKPCSRKSWVANNPEAAAESKRQARRKAKRNGYKKPLRGPFVCRNCGKGYFTNRHKGEGETYCSRDCSFEHKKAVARKAVPLSSVRFASCSVCGKWFRTERNQRICSDDCRKQRAREKARIRNEAQHNPEERVCRECGKRFKPKYGSPRKVFCSAKCSSRSSNRNKERSNHRKRARRYGVAYEYINTIKVLRRDGWTCQICGRKTPERLRGTIKPNAPELDHRVPLSLGGGHTWDNVQCACRQCNGDKGNTKPLGQMNLFNKAA